METYSHFEPLEGLLESSNTFELDKKSRQVIIKNDSQTATLKFKFTLLGNFGSILPTESIVMNVWTDKVFLECKGSCIPYRLWVFG